VDAEETEFVDMGAVEIRFQMNITLFWVGVNLGLFFI